MQFGIKSLGISTVDTNNKVVSYRPTIHSNSVWCHCWKKCRRSISLCQHTLAQLCYGRNLNCLSFRFETIENPSSIAISLPEPVSSSLAPVSTSLMQLCASLFPCNTRISLSLRKSWLYKCPLEILRNVTQQNFGLVSIFSSENKGN